MNETDVVVVGAGLAGSCAAITMARRGVRVTLLEAGTFPRHKVCGEFLSPESRPIFRRLGLEDKLQQAGAMKVERARLIAPNSDALELDLPSPALAISRFSLDEILWNTARDAGAQCYENTRVRATDRNGAFHVSTSRGDYHAAGVVEASGRGRKAKHASADTKQRSRYFGLKTHIRKANLEVGVTELHAFPGGYCGLVRVENGLTNVCLMAHYSLWQRSRARTPEALFRYILSCCPTLSLRVRDAEFALPWLATGNLGFDSITPIDDGILRCGDAAGFIPPFTGDGMAMAVRAGELAGATLAARLNHGDASKIYQAAWRREFETRLNIAKALHPFFMQPQLSRCALFMAAHFPPLAQFLLSKTRG